MFKSLLIKNLAIGFSIFFLAFAVLCFVKAEPVFADDTTPVYIVSDINYGHTFTGQYSDFGAYLYHLLSAALKDSGFFTSEMCDEVALDFLYQMRDFGLNSGPFAEWTPENPTFYCDATLLFAGDSLYNKPYIYLLFFPASGYVDLDQPFRNSSGDALTTLPSDGYNPYYVGQNTYNSSTFSYMYDPNGYAFSGTYRWFFPDSTDPSHFGYWLPFWVRPHVDPSHNTSYRFPLYNNIYHGGSDLSYYRYNSEGYYYRGSNTGTGFLTGSSFTSYQVVYSFGDTSSLDSSLYTSFTYGLSRNEVQGFCFDLSDYLISIDGSLSGKYFRNIIYPVYVGRDYSDDSTVDISLQGFVRRPLFSMGYTYALSSIGDIYFFSTGSSSNSHLLQFGIFDELMYTDPGDMRAALKSLPFYTEAFRITDVPPVTPGPPTPTSIPGYEYLTPTPFPTYWVSATVTPITISSNPDFDIDTGSLFGDIKGYISVFTNFLNSSVFAWSRDIFQRFVVFGSDPIFSVLVFLPVIGLIAFILGRLLFK